MSADPGEEFEVDPAPEKMNVKPKKPVKVVKSKSPEELERLEKKKE